MKVELTPEEINAIVSGLSMSANFIETVNPVMTSVDVEKSGRGKLRGLNDGPNGEYRNAKAPPRPLNEH